MRTKKLIQLFIFLCLLIPQITISQSSTTKKTQSASSIKASFIYSFTKGIKWPNEEQMTVFKIGVLNSDELAKNLSAMVSTNKFKKKIPFQILNFKKKSDITPCQLLVINANDNNDLKFIFNKIKNNAGLLVAENLLDYKSSSISFVEVDRHMKFIINKSKLSEAGLIASEVLYDMSITKATDWNNLFSRYEYLAGSSHQKEVKMNTADLQKMIGEYSNLEKEKAIQEATIKQMEDSLERRIQMFNSKMVEYRKIQTRIEENKLKLKKQEDLMNEQRAELNDQAIKIGEQKTVIIIIVVLGSISIIFLLFAIRSNLQRKKANKLLFEQKKVVEHQKQLVDEKQKEIVDSINYARRIQTALMAHDKLLSKHLPEHFVLFRPKDIVAGDFYWATPTSGGFMYVTGDCTGHGVPGAFMSLLNISKLNETINQKNITRPDLVFNDIRNEITRALNPEDSTEDSKDGMDAVLCKLDLKNMKLQYAAANNAFYIIRNKEVFVCKADKMHVGKAFNIAGTFTFCEFELQKGDAIYTFSDGYSDQFGGPNRKRFKSNQLKELLVNISHLTMPEQKNKLTEAFENWKGDIEQIDDVLVIGVRV